MKTTKTSLHRTDNQTNHSLSSDTLNRGLKPEGLAEEEIYSTAANVLESDIYENVQQLRHNGLKACPTICSVE